MEVATRSGYAAAGVVLGKAVGVMMSPTSKGARLARVLGLKVA